MRIDPEGTRVALSISAGGLLSDIWIQDLVRETMTRLTFNGGHFPLWTPDGKRIAFISIGRGKAFDGLGWKAADGTGEVQKLGLESEQLLLPWSWSGDGKTMVLSRVSMSGKSMDIVSLSMEGDRKWKLLLKEAYEESQPFISADGRWMAYESDESGQSQIYVRPFPEVEKGRWQVSTGGGNSPLWSRDGKELFYRSGDSVIAVAVETEPTLKLGKPEILFHGGYVPSSSTENTWDVSPDGKRFLMMKELAPSASATAAEGPRKINIVLHWFEELKQRAPVK
jgi:eukaryotic-like serine/threonine-protein kinase